MATNTYGTLTANGSGEPVWISGEFLLVAAGTWDSGTLTVEIKSRDGTWSALNADTAHTSDATGQALYKVPGTHEVRATLAGAVSAPSIKWEFFGERAIGR